MDAGKRTINDIFNGNRILEIPFFQRAYVWKEEQWERLLEDMENVSKTKESYFLGSVILKQRLANADNRIGDIRTLIDGQQRLTTLSIFFKVLCLKKDINWLFERVFTLGRDNEQLALSHNHKDIDSFTKVLKLSTLEELGGNDNIIEAYNFFRKELNVDRVDGQAILDNITFVGIDLTIEEDEQQIFDTINSLGVRLTTAELLKNYFFDRGEIQEYNEYWNNVFERDEKIKRYWDREITTGNVNRIFIDLFFYSFLQIKIQEPKLEVESDDKNEFSKVESLFQSYKSLIKKYKLNKNEILREIRDYANLFKENFKYDIIDNELTDEFGIERINAIIFGLDTSTLIPYILYVLKNNNNQKEINELFGFIESYVMRRIVVRASTRSYKQLFSENLISNEVITKKQFADFIKKSSETINYLPNDAKLETGFKESILINKQSAGILYFIESKVRNRDRQATQLLGISKYSLEHLMPKRWENNWGSLGSDKEIYNRNNKLLTLGNLTIITQSLNTAIRDADWNTKKNGNGNQRSQGLIHYSAGIETLSRYLDLEKWNEEEIEKRANYLYDKALEIWKIDNEPVA